jgi:hypothetical protein
MKDFLLFQGIRILFENLFPNQLIYCNYEAQHYCQTYQEFKSDVIIEEDHCLWADKEFKELD